MVEGRGAHLRFIMAVRFFLIFAAWQAMTTRRVRTSAPTAPAATPTTSDLLMQRFPSKKFVISSDEPQLTNIDKTNELSEKLCAKTLVLTNCPI